MKVVYVAHPLGAGPDREKNRQRAARWVAWVGDQGCAPVADWIILSGVWSENRRDEGLSIDVELVKRCDELWLVGGRVSAGMSIEADAARKAGIPVVDKTHLGEEPPAR
jgi:hypothetical protein